MTCFASCLFNTTVAIICAVAIVCTDLLAIKSDVLTIDNVTCESETPVLYSPIVAVDDIVHRRYRAVNFMSGDVTNRGAGLRVGHSVQDRSRRDSQSVHF